MQFKWQLANAPKYAIAFDDSHWIIIDANESKDSGVGQQTRSFDWQLAYTHFARLGTPMVEIIGLDTKLFLFIYDYSFIHLIYECFDIAIDIQINEFDPYSFRFNLTWVNLLFRPRV